MLGKIGYLLLQLHRDCRRPTVDNFPNWARELFQTAIPCDACFWGSGCRVDGETIAHSFWFHNIPLESMQTWEQHKQHDSIGAKLFVQLNRVINLTHAELQNEHAYIYQHLFRDFGVEQFLGTYTYSEATGLYDALSLYRSDPANPFSEEERQALECLVPNLVEARRANYLNHMTSAPGEALHHHLAAADMKGILHAIEDRFAELVASEWPDWRGPRLPEPLIAHLKNGQGRYLASTIAIDFRRSLDMTLLYARTRMPIDNLSQRQIEIARAVSGGQSHKEIAQSLDLAPSTIRNHISTIYQMLGIGGKAELATLLAKYVRPIQVRPG